MRYTGLLRLHLNSDNMVRIEIQERSIRPSGRERKKDILPLI